MIVDISNEVFTNLKTNLVDITVLPCYPSTSPVFPCVVFEELSNTENDGTSDTSGEKYNDVILEINIFSNSENKITEVKDIRNQVDNIMSGTYGMHRSFSNTTSNFSDTNIYRYTLRYAFTIGQNKTIYRR